MKPTQEFERLMAEAKSSQTATEELWKWYDYSAKKDVAKLLEKLESWADVQLHL